MYWACTEASSRVKHAECVEQDGGHDIRCLYSFSWERNRQGEGLPLLWAPFRADTQDNDSRPTTDKQAAETVPAGEDHTEPHPPW